MAARSKARKRALDILFASELRSEDPVVALERAIEAGEGPTNDYTGTLVRGVVEHLDRIDEVLTTYSKGWTLNRMPGVDRNVLRIGVFELLWGDADVPESVAVSEALHLVQDLSTDESPTFVNGLLGSIMAIGSLTGALMAARRRESRVRLVVLAGFGFGITAGINALMPTYWTYAISCILVGYFTLTLLTSANMAIQTSVDPMMRGRIMALYQVVLMGSTPIGAPIVGWIASNVHPRWGIGIGAVAAILVSLGALIWVRRHWNVTFEYRSASPEPRQRRPRRRVSGGISSSSSTSAAHR